MLSFLFKVFLLLGVVQFVRGGAGSTGRATRARPSKNPRPQAQASSDERVGKPDYKDLSPYEIEDAEFEELPKGRS